MFFTYVARLLAGLVLLLGVLTHGAGFAIASGWLGPEPEVMARYWPHSTTGRMIDQGGVAVILGLSLGVLAEISLGVRKLLSRG